MHYVAESTIRDVKWSPFFGNILALMLEDGRLLIFNLALNKFKPICVQLLVDHSDLAPPYGCISFCPTNAYLILICANGHDLTTYKIPQSVRKTREGGAGAGGAAAKKKGTSSQTSIVCDGIEGVVIDQTYLDGEKARIEKIFFSLK